MRIESTARSGTAARSGASRSGAAIAFDIGESEEAPRAEAAMPMAAANGIDALLALQSVEDPLFAKKKAIRRGNALLDTLEEIKADLLVGRVSEGRLNQLMVLIRQARQRQLVGLDAVLDDIELRARVELAKFGRFTGP